MSTRGMFRDISGVTPKEKALLIEFKSDRNRKFLFSSVQGVGNPMTFGNMVDQMEQSFLKFKANRSGDELDIDDLNAVFLAEIETLRQRRKEYNNFTRTKYHTNKNIPSTILPRSMMALDVDHKVLEFFK